jgi:hypothetical protein
MAAAVFAEILQHLRHWRDLSPKAYVLHILESKQIQITLKQNIYLHVLLEEVLCIYIFTLFSHFFA